MARPRSRRIAPNYVLEASAIKPPGLDSLACEQVIKFTDGFWVIVVVDRTAEHSCEVMLEHFRPDGERVPMRYTLRLTATRPNFGGLRWWWLCPRNGARVAKLVMPFSSREFASRRAYGLAYQSQRDGRVDRLAAKARRLHIALGGDGMALGQGVASLAWKPAGKHWRKWEERVQQWLHADRLASRVLFGLSDQ